MRTWDAATGAELHCFRAHVYRVITVAYSPDGQPIASGSLDKTVRICLTTSLWQTACLAPAAAGGVTSLAWHRAARATRPVLDTYFPAGSCRNPHCALRGGRL